MRSTPVASSRMHSVPSDAGAGVLARATTEAQRSTRSARAPRGGRDRSTRSTRWLPERPDVKRLNLDSVFKIHPPSQIPNQVPAYQPAVRPWLGKVRNFNGIQRRPVSNASDPVGVAHRSEPEPRQGPVTGCSAYPPDAPLAIRCASWSEGQAIREQGLEHLAAVGVVGERGPEAGELRSRGGLDSTLLMRAASSTGVRRAAMICALCLQVLDPLRALLPQLRRQLGDVVGHHDGVRRATRRLGLRKPAARLLARHHCVRNDMVAAAHIWLRSQP
jgi:hypothetical protein